MLFVDMTDPDTYWLNITNIGLGIVTLVCVMVVGYGILLEAVMRLKQRAQVHGPAEDHAFRLPELGLTMADGGEREDKQQK